MEGTLTALKGFTMEVNLLRVTRILPHPASGAYVGSLRELTMRVVHKNMISAGLAAPMTSFLRYLTKILFDKF